jgi:hypothetical protein
MKNNLLVISIAIVGVIATQNAAALIACNNSYSSSSRTDNRIYAGLSWQLNGSNGFVPDIIFGARSLNVNSDNAVSGADFNLRLNIKKDISLDSMRLSYVGGSRDLLGNAGLGYSFTNSGIFATAAAQSAYSRLGADYQFGNEKFTPYLEINTLYSPNEESARVSTSCTNPV